MTPQTPNSPQDPVPNNSPSSSITPTNPLTPVDPATTGVTPIGSVSVGSIPVGSVPVGSGSSRPSNPPSITPQTNTSTANPLPPAQTLPTFAGHPFDASMKGIMRRYAARILRFVLKRMYPDLQK